MSSRLRALLPQGETLVMQPGLHGGILLPGVMLLAAGTYAWDKGRFLEYVSYARQYGVEPLLMQARHLLSEDASLLVGVVLLALGAYALCKELAQLLSVEVGVTNRRVLRVSGVFNPKVVAITLPNIENITLTQGVLGKLLGYGTLVIEGVGFDPVIFPKIMQVKQVHARLVALAKQA